ncbi:uncharacterized protein EAE98_002609 [Botrytis deweyae]|uniref:Uncharacterized protein n=1 Tax=Botrytis deweyae TaxID=2478750 RepID=A0ABQ7IXN2_9HELO|nr:uncharacterized protein EAE98_002609 [Botrytis deweyae]KAF7936390.1 hypothetical protein EAE98_002609 [Botrytis deweyae]
MEETAAAVAAEGITVQEFTNRAAVANYNNAVAQCKTRAAELLAAEAEFRALASLHGDFNGIDNGSSSTNRDMVKDYWESLISS